MKVTTVSETRYLTTLRIVVLFGKLREQELEMNRLKEQENGERQRELHLAFLLKGRKIVRNVQVIVVMHKY